MTHLVLSCPLKTLLSYYQHQLVIWKMQCGENMGHGGNSDNYVDNNEFHRKMAYGNTFTVINFYLGFFFSSYCSC